MEIALIYSLYSQVAPIKSLETTSVPSYKSRDMKNLVSGTYMDIPSSYKSRLRIQVLARHRLHKTDFKRFHRLGVPVWSPAVLNPSIWVHMCKGLIFVHTPM